MSGLLAKLLQIGQSLDRSNFFPTLVPGATAFALSDPFAFLLACCLDRGTKTELIWTVPFDLRNRLGHLDSAKLASMPVSEIRELVADLPRKPRYVHATPRTISELAQLVVRRGGGDARRLWQGSSAAMFKAAVRTVHGVGPQLANMTPLLVEMAFGVRFPDRPTIDIKADVHTMRVLYRLGLASAPDASSAVAAARQLNPSFPGEVDAPLWTIGRRWCSPSSPSCSACPVAPWCARVGVERR